MISFMISVVPPKIVCTLLSVNARAIGYSRMYPYPPCSWTHRSTTRLHSSVSHHFTIAASAADRLPALCSSTALSVNARATASSVAISASTNRLCWNFPIALPKACLSLQYARVVANAVSAPASAVAPIARRSLGRFCMSATNPPPFAEQVAGRHPDVAEEQFRGVLGMHADLVQV